MEDKKIEKYLPIGTVVLLKDGKKPVMITGYCSYASEPNTKLEELNGAKMYDYNGCLYPEGLIESDKILLFDHSQIDRIYFMGYSTNLSVEFIEKLKKVVTENNLEATNDIKRENDNNESIENLEI